MPHLLKYVLAELRRGPGGTQQTLPDAIEKIEIQAERRMDRPAFDEKVEVRYRFPGGGQWRTMSFTVPHQRIIPDAAVYHAVADWLKRELEPFVHILNEAEKRKELQT
jgi:hypothetical protein